MVDASQLIPTGGLCAPFYEDGKSVPTSIVVLGTPITSEDGTRLMLDNRDTRDTPAWLYWRERFGEDTQ